MTVVSVFTHTHRPYSYTYMQTFTGHTSKPERRIISNERNEQKN